MLNCSSQKTFNKPLYLTARLQKKVRKHNITSIQEVSTHTVFNITHNSATSLRNTPKTFGIWIQTGSELTHLQCITVATAIFILFLTCTTLRASFNRAPP